MFVAMGNKAGVIIFGICILEQCKYSKGQKADLGWGITGQLLFVVTFCSVTMITKYYCCHTPKKSNHKEYTVIIFNDKHAEGDFQVYTESESINDDDDSENGYEFNYGLTDHSTDLNDDND